GVSWQSHLRGTTALAVPASAEPVPSGPSRRRRSSRQPPRGCSSSCWQPGHGAWSARGAEGPDGTGHVYQAQGDLVASGGGKIIVHRPYPHGGSLTRG